MCRLSRHSRLSTMPMVDQGCALDRSVRAKRRSITPTTESTCIEVPSPGSASARCPGRQPGKVSPQLGLTPRSVSLKAAEYLLLLLRSGQIIRGRTCQSGLTPPETLTISLPGSPTAMTQAGGATHRPDIQILAAAGMDFGATTTPGRSESRPKSSTDSQWSVSHRATGCSVGEEVLRYS